MANERGACDATTPLAVPGMRHGRHAGGACCASTRPGEATQEARALRGRGARYAVVGLRALGKVLLPDAGE